MSHSSAGPQPIELDQNVETIGYTFVDEERSLSSGDGLPGKIELCTANFPILHSEREKRDVGVYSSALDGCKAPQLLSKSNFPH